MTFCEPLEPRQLLASNGLNAVYFNNADFAGKTASRADAQVSFTWNKGSPAKKINATTFSVRWTALIKAYTSGTYTFITKNNDGVRLWVNGKLLVDSWKSQPTTTRTAKITLTKNNVYDLRMEHFADSGGSYTVQLAWDPPDRGAVVVANSRLFAYDTRSASIGDYGFDNDNEAAVAKMMRGWKPHFITTVGDNNYPNGEASTIDRNVGKYFFDFIGNYKGSYGTGATPNLFFPVLGNHDWDSSSGASPYLNYFTLPGNERYYDFVQGSIHFFAIDSDSREPDGASPGSKQGQWLKNALAKSTSPFNIVYFHHAPYSSGSEGSSTHMQWQFKDWGADLVLAGHSHSYERLSKGGMTYIVNGAGARPNGIHEIVSGSIVRNGSEAGALLIQANDIALTLQYQVRSGKVIDTITLGRS
jgi:hypothetical protein